MRDISLVVTVSDTEDEASEPRPSRSANLQPPRPSAKRRLNPGSSSSSTAVVVTGGPSSSSAGVGASGSAVPARGVVEIPLDPDQEVEIGPGCVLIGESLQPPGSIRELFEDLQGCCIFDLFKTVIFPESLIEDISTRVDRQSELSGVNYQVSHFRIGYHRGEHQTIFASTTQLLARLAGAGVVYIGLTFIGRNSHREYVNALKESKLTKIIPIIIVVNERQGKAAVAERIGAACAFDDQVDHIRRYRQAGVRAYQVSGRWGLATHPQEVFREALWYCLGKDEPYR